jgi:diguanylate cyclase (GGDEF)-like protein
MAAAALAPPEPAREDHDVAELLVDGLLGVSSAARVRRVRLDVGQQTVYEAAHPEGERQAEALAEPAVRRAVSAIEPIPRRGPGGEVVALMAPLVSRAGSIDLFILEAQASGSGLTAQDSAVIATLRDQAAAALAVRQAQAEARVDPLTGCLNHGAMRAQLAKEIARVQRQQGRLSLVMLDLDDFKAINESHGHPVGDEVLRAVSTAMREQCRPYDSCCRYGGDEFVIILPDTGIVDAVRTAERLRAAIARAVVVLDGTEISVAATAGVADWHADESADALIERVDQALLAGKGAGKDGIGLA